MAKKKAKKVDAVDATEVVDTGIGRLDQNFNRQDMNNVVAKINELVEAVNSK